MSELKPCPFCRSTNWSLWYNGAYYYVACVDCEAQGSKGKTRDEAVEAWNKAIRDAVKEATEPKKGKWLMVEDADEDGNARYECSLCHAGETHTPSVKVSYCWNCGAKMIEGE